MEFYILIVHESHRGLINLLRVRLPSATAAEVEIEEEGMEI